MQLRHQFGLKVLRNSDSHKASVSSAWHKVIASECSTRNSQAFKFFAKLWEKPSQSQLSKLLITFWTSCLKVLKPFAMALGLSRQASTASDKFAIDAWPVFAEEYNRSCSRHSFCGRIMES